MDSFLAQDLAATKEAVLTALAKVSVRVYLFGSIAGADYCRTSDIDVAVLPLEPLPLGLLSALAESLEQSNILRHVDLVDLSRTSAAFRDNVIREGLPWRS